MGTPSRAPIMPMPARNSLISPASVRLPSGKISTENPAPSTSPMYRSVSRAPASRCGSGKALKNVAAR